MRRVALAAAQQSPEERRRRSEADVDATRGPLSFYDDDLPVGGVSDDGGVFPDGVFEEEAIALPVKAPAPRPRRPEHPQRTDEEAKPPEKPCRAQLTPQPHQKESPSTTRKKKKPPLISPEYDTLAVLLQYDARS